MPASGPQRLAQILAAPDDDAARLALAEQLLAQGDPRGELIAVQYFTRLRHLNLGATKLGARGIAALLATRAFPRLRVLTLYTAKDPAQRRALESALGVKVDIGDFEQSLGLAPPLEWQQ